MSGELILDGTSYDLPASTDFGAWVSGYLQGSSWKHAKLSGVHTTVSGVNLQQVRQGVFIDATDLVLTGQNISCVVDMMGATGVHWRKGVIAGGGGVGSAFFLARESAGQAAGKHVFEFIEVVGKYEAPAVSCVGSESNRWIFPRIENTDPYGVCIHFGDAADYYGAAPLSGTPATDGTETNADLVGARLKSKGDVYEADGVTPRDVGALLIDGFDRVHCSGMLYTNSNLPGVCVSTKTGGVAGVVVENLTWYPVNQFPEEALRLCGPFGNGLAGCDFHVKRAFRDGARVITVEGTHPTDPGLEFTACTFRHHEDDRGAPTALMEPIEWDGSTWNHCELRDRFGVYQLDGEAPT